MLSAFQTASMVAPSRSPKQVLQNVKIIAEPDRVSLIATDMEVGIQLNVSDVEVEVSGSALLSVSQFGAILRESSDETLRVEADDAGVQVFGDRSKFKIPSSDPNTFPSISSFEEESYHSVPAKLIRELIKRTLFATDSESSRYALGGVLLEMEPDSITAVGTDGRRLAKMEGEATSVEGHTSGDTMTIVPSRAMLLIDRSLHENDEELKLCVRGNDLLVSSATATINARLVEGRFPRWRDVFPKDRDSIDIDLTVGPMYSALRQASIVTSNESRGIDFTFGDGTLILAGTTADIGESRVELPIGYDGQEIKLCLDHRYVGDFLKVLEPEKSFTLNVVDGDNAALFTTEDGYGYVVMPLAREKAVAAAAAASAG